MDLVAEAPRPLFAIALSGIVLGVMPLLWMLRRFLRFVRRREQSSVSFSRYFFTLSTSALLLGVGIGATGLLAAIHGYRAFTEKTRVATVQCIELMPSTLRVYYSDVREDGTVAEAETYDIRGDQWTVGGEVLRFRPFLTPLGVRTLHKITRIEGHWVKAEDANANRATAIDRNGGVSDFWIAAHRYGTSGPLAWLVEGVHGQAVSQFPDRLAVYDLYVTPNGYVLDKRSLE